MSIEGQVLSLSCAIAIVNYLAWLPKRQRTSRQSISAEIVPLAAVLPKRLLTVKGDCVTTYQIGVAAVGRFFECFKGYGKV